MRDAYAMCRVSFDCVLYLLLATGLFCSYTIYNVTSHTPNFFSLISKLRTKQNSFISFHGAVGCRPFIIFAVRLYIAIFGTWFRMRSGGPPAAGIMGVLFSELSYLIRAS